MTLNANDIEDITGVLQGYEAWRRHKVLQSEAPDHDPLSVHAYLDEYAKQRALDVLGQIQAIYADGSMPWQEVDAEIRNLIGVQR